MEHERIGSLQAKEEALEGFRARGLEHKNCAQAVVHFSMRTLGRDPELATAARFMGGGMARMGHTCGAVTGAVLSLGLRDLSDPDGVDADVVQVTEWLQGLIHDFEQEFAAVSCLELTGYDLSTREGYKAYVKSDAQPRCILYLEWVIDRLSDVL